MLIFLGVLYIWCFVELLSTENIAFWGGLELVAAIFVIISVEFHR